MKLRNIVVLIYSLALVSACGSSGGSTTPTSPSSQNAAPASVTPPAASIQRAITTVLSGMSASINGTRSGSRQLTLSDGRLTGGTFLAGPQSFTTQCNASGSSCSVQFNESFNQRTNCANGGSSNVSATLTGVIQGSATLGGTLNMSVRSTFADCSENGWVTNSNPSIGTSGTMFITGQHTRINLTMSGGFLIINAPGTPNGRASCVFNGVLLQWDDITGNWANSGSVDCNPGGAFRFL